MDIITNQKEEAMKFWVYKHKNKRVFVRKYKYESEADKLFESPFVVDFDKITAKNRKAAIQTFKELEAEAACL